MQKPENKLSPYKINHLMVMAFGKVITKDDQRKILGSRLGIARGRRVIFLFNREIDAERERLEALRLSKQMQVFPITDAQFGACGKDGFTWFHYCPHPRNLWEPEYFVMPKPTRMQWDRAFHIGLTQEQN